MRSAFLLAVALCAAFVFTGCGLLGGGDSKREDCAAIFKSGYRSQTEKDYFSANCSNLFEYDGPAVTVGLTDNVPASGTYVLQNIYNPRVRQIIGIVQIENAKLGTHVTGRWYQMGVIQQKAPNITAGGALVSEASFDITTDSISTDTKKGGGRLTLAPNAPLPEDAYELRVYVDGKLAKTQPFVVSNLVPGPATTTNPTPAATPAATPVRTPTPSR